jgi:hypothetical protein
VLNRTQQAAIVSLLNLCWVTYGAATTVLVYVSSREAIIAADSLSNRVEGGQRMVCKIVQVSDHMLFVAAGTGLTENPHFNPHDLAKTSVASSRSPHEAAVQYASNAIAPLQEIWRANRVRYVDLLAGAHRPEPTGPQDFMFVGFNQTGLISASGTNFVGDASSPPNVRVNDFRELVGKNPGHFFLYETGIYDAFPSDDQINRWINADGAPAALKRAIEMQIKATPDLVGGDISIVRLSRDGSIQWLNRGECK